MVSQTNPMEESEPAGLLASRDVGASLNMPVVFLQ